MENDVHYVLGVRAVFDLDSVPDEEYVDHFTGVVDVVVRDAFEIRLLVREGYVQRAVPNLKTLQKARLWKVMKMYFRHVGAYFVFDWQS